MSRPISKPSAPNPHPGSDLRAAQDTAFRKKILVVDDHPIVLFGLSQLINQQPDLEICGEAIDASQAMKQVELVKPDLAIVDISLEGKSGMELIKDLQAVHPEVLILVLSMHDEGLYAERSLRAGARGYVMKRSGAEALLKAIRQVLEGKLYLSQKMSETFLEIFSGFRPARSNSPLEMLTDREFEVFKLIGEGCGTKDIAHRLRISSKTVDVYRRGLKEKLKIASSTSLIQHAVRWVQTQTGTS